MLLIVKDLSNSQRSLKMSELIDNIIENHLIQKDLRKYRDRDNHTAEIRAMKGKIPGWWHLVVWLLMIIGVIAGTANYDFAVAGGWFLCLILIVATLVASVIIHSINQEYRKQTYHKTMTEEANARAVAANDPGLLKDWYQQCDSAVVWLQTAIGLTYDVANYLVNKIVYDRVVDLDTLKSYAMVNNVTESVVQDATYKLYRLSDLTEQVLETYPAKLIDSFIAASHKQSQTESSVSL